jgi:metal-sulfur cluster biosynthetic enzyme
MSQDSETTTIWEADSTHPTEAEALREGLRTVMDPELGLNIIELGLVRDVVMTDDSQEIKMILTTPFCPYGPAMLDMTRNKGEDVTEKSTTIEVGMEMWDPSMMEAGAGGEWGLF